MPIDNKYGRVTLEHGTVGDDEPVVVFRAQDALLPKVLDIYAFLCEIAGSPKHHLEAIRKASMLVKGWQAQNRTKTPSSDSLKEEK
jgi:hypothetical protein